MTNTLDNQNTPDEIDDLNMLWDCFYPYDKQKTLEKWKALITAARIEAQLELLKSLIFEEVDVTDLERWEYQYDGQPMPVIKEQTINRLIATLTNDKEETQE